MNFIYQKIYYSAHIDRCIHQYYTALLSEKYNLKLKEKNIENVPVAYRGDLHANNITIVKEVFDFIKNKKSIYIIVGDFTDFFGKIDHKYLKKQLCNILDVTSLPNDYYAIFKNITKYSWIELEDILKINHLKFKRKNIRKINKQSKVLTSQQFKDHLDSIQYNKLPYGIPQGSAISACLSNIYMIEIDKLINEFVTKRQGIYRRYSDDFIIVLPTSISGYEDLEEILKKFQILKKDKILELQPEKTQIFELNNKLKNIGYLFGLPIETKTLNFWDLVLMVKIYFLEIKVYQSIIIGCGIRPKVLHEIIIKTNEVLLVQINYINYILNVENMEEEIF